MSRPISSSSGHHAGAHRINDRLPASFVGAFDGTHCNRVPNRRRRCRIHSMVRHFWQGVSKETSASRNTIRSLTKIKRTRGLIARADRPPCIVPCYSHGYRGGDIPKPHLFMRFVFSFKRATLEGIPFPQPVHLYKFLEGHCIYCKPRAVSHATYRSEHWQENPTGRSTSMCASASRTR
jgi:hypothetical protein